MHNYHEISKFVKSHILLLVLQTQGVQNTAGTVYSKLRSIFKKSLVEGETPVKIFTTSIVLEFEKNRADKFSNKTIDLGDGSFKLPNWCSLMDTCNPNETVVVQVSIPYIL